MLLPTAYLPPVSWCTAFWNAEAVTLEACEHYQKGGFRNRMVIAGPNGRQMLSIPLVKGKHQQTPIREVRIAHSEPWQRQHWRSIRTAYGNAPFFEHYADELAAFYEKQHRFLFDLNLEWIEFVLIKKMGWTGEIGLSTEYRAVQPVEMSVHTPYPQVFLERHGFLPDLSVLDLLLCCGKAGGAVLRREH